MNTLTSTSRTAQQGRAKRLAWWLGEAQRAAARCVDAPRPHNVDVRATAAATSVVRSRIRRHDATLIVTATDFRRHSGRDTGRWLAAWAASAGRWPVPVQKGSVTGPAMLVIAAILAGLFAINPGTVREHILWAAAAVVCGASGVGLWLWRRRQRTLMMQWSDEHAVEVAGLSAAEAVLGGGDDSGLYKTALHQWWRRTDPQRPANRLRRLQQRHRSDDDAGK